MRSSTHLGYNLSFIITKNNELYHNIPILPQNKYKLRLKVLSVECLLKSRSIKQVERQPCPQIKLRRHRRVQTRLEKLQNKNYLNPSMCRVSLKLLVMFWISCLSKKRTSESSLPPESNKNHPMTPKTKTQMSQKCTRLNWNKFRLHLCSPQQNRKLIKLKKIKFNMLNSKNQRRNLTLSKKK